MPFRYVDSEGTEVEVPSVDGLRFRIAAGDVTPGTFLYDAAVGRWALAQHHRVFRSLVDDHADLLPKESRTTGEGSEGEDGEAGPPESDPVSEGPSGDALSTAPASNSSTALEGSEGPVQTNSRPSGNPRIEELDIPVGLVAHSGPTGGSGGDGGRTARPRPAPVSSRSGRPRRVRGLALALLLLLGGGVTLVYLVETRGVALAAGGDGSDPESTGSENPVTSLVTAIGTAVPGSWIPAGDDRVRARAEDELESLAAEVTGGVSVELARATAELQDALGVDERPPEEWLQGGYLAGADRYPGVREYWRDFGAYVASARALDEELYRGFVQDRVLEMGLEAGPAAGLSARILGRYERSAEERERAYDALTALAGEALALHELLARRSAAISHEPLTGRELSRDAVLEAVAYDTELADRIWRRVHLISELLKRSRQTRSVSMLQLQDALPSDLRMAEVEPRVP